MKQNAQKIGLVVLAILVVAGLKLLAADDESGQRKAGAFGGEPVHAAIPLVQSAPPHPTSYFVGGGELPDAIYPRKHVPEGAARHSSSLAEASMSATVGNAQRKIGRNLGSSDSAGTSGTSVVASATEPLSVDLGDLTDLSQEDQVAVRSYLGASGLSRAALEFVFDIDRSSDTHGDPVAARKLAETVNYIASGSGPSPFCDGATLTLSPSTRVRCVLAENVNLASLKADDGEGCHTVISWTSEVDARAIEFWVEPTTTPQQRCTSTLRATVVTGNTELEQTQQVMQFSPSLGNSLPESDQG